MTTNAENLKYTVQRLFRDHGPMGHAVRVIGVKLQHDERHNHDWWMVHVEINVPLEQLFGYYAMLSEVEEKLEAEEGINSLIVPTIPEEQAA